MDLFPTIPESFSELGDEQLAAFIAESEQTFTSIRADSASYITEDRSAADLVGEMQVAADALSRARAEASSREDTEDAASADDVAAIAEQALAASADDTDDAAADGDEAGEAADDEDAAAAGEDDDDEDAAAGEEDGSATAAASTRAPAVQQVPAPPLPRPARARRSTPLPERRQVALTASAPNLGPDLGEEITGLGLAEMMMKRRRDFGRIPPGTSGEKIPLAKMDWADTYGSDRTLDGDEIENQHKIAAALDTDVIRTELERRKTDALTASGGLCAPVTPYYDLAMISQGERPVRAALPSFNAVRGGIRFARPAALTAITTAVGVVTASEDELGGTYATKTCQVVACPDFSEVDVRAIYHCLQFGNLPSRTFPELLAQWTDLVVAAHARTAESDLLTDIATGSTAVTASALGLGATATLPSQIITAAAGMRSRHRMAQDAVLRVMLPSWVLDLLVSDQYRTQFQRFDMTKDDFVRILRAANVEPSFYVDGAAGQGQVFGAQGAGSLLNFPDVVVWYIFPEGSWLYLDGGTLELGLVRDSVLNETNDFQIFGETFEAVAFVGVESLRVYSTVCDNGTVSLPNDVNCPIDY